MTGVPDTPLPVLRVSRRVKPFRRESTHMPPVEEVLQLEEIAAEVVHSRSSPIRFTLKVEPLHKESKPWWRSDFARTVAITWLPILTACYFIVSLVIGHALKDLNGTISGTVAAQLKPISDKLDDVNSRLHNIEGWREGVEGNIRILKESQQDINTRLGRQEALARVEDPNRILGEIRTEVKLAQDRRGVIPPPQLADYRNALRALPPSAQNYWITVAEIINYQSLLNQMSGTAPDPTTVAKPCGIVGPNSYNNTFAQSTFPDCIAYIDSNHFRNITFRNSVIIYRGGPADLVNVVFDNCRFQLELPPGRPVNASQQKLLYALLDSPDQKSIQVSAQ